MFISDRSFWVNSKNKYSSTTKIKCGVPRVASQILSSNSRVFKGSPGYFFWIFQGLCHLDSRVFQGIMQKIRNFPGIRIKKCFLEHRKKILQAYSKTQKYSASFSVYAVPVQINLSTNNISLRFLTEVFLHFLLFSHVFLVSKLFLLVRLREVTKVMKLFSFNSQ